MALYEITQDCRIANKEYQKGDIVSNNEVGGFYPTVMKETNSLPKSEKKIEKKSEKKDEEEKSELTDEENEEIQAKPKKWQSKKK